MALRTVNVLSLCTGLGGLELGLRMAGVRARTVCVVEREAFVAACVVKEMLEGRVDDAPVWSDLETFDGRPWRGKVHLVAAGFPCQPWSTAGKRRGTRDERWIWPWISRVVREVGPERVFLENVPGLLAGGLGHVLGDLASLGFDAEWGVFSAGAVGSSQLRRRVFVLADRGGERRQQKPAGPHGDEEKVEGRCEENHFEPERHVQGVVDADHCGEAPSTAPGEGGRRTAEHSNAGEGLADADGVGLQGLRVGRLPGDGREARREDADGRGGEGEGLEHPEGAGPQEPARGQRFGEGHPGPERAGVPLFPPGPGERGEWATVLLGEPRLAPALADPGRERRDGGGRASRRDGAQAMLHSTAKDLMEDEVEDGVPRRLNPWFVEWLMGYPADWSDPDTGSTGFGLWETRSSRWLRRLLGPCSSEGWGSVEGMPGRW